MSSVSGDDAFRPSRGSARSRSLSRDPTRSPSAEPDARGVALRHHVDAFEEGLRDLKKRLSKLLASHVRHIKDVREFAAALAGANPVFPDEACISLRERAANLGRGFLTMAKEDEVNMVATLRAQVLAGVTDMDEQLLAPLRELLQDRQRRVRRVRRALRRVSALRDKILNSRKDSSRFGDRVEKELDDAVKERELAGILLQNVDDQVDFHVEMFEFHRVRHLKQIWASLVSAHLVHHTVAAEHLGALALDVRKIDAADAQEAMRERIRHGGLHATQE